MSLGYVEQHILFRGYSAPNICRIIHLWYIFCKGFFFFFFFFFFFVLFIFVLLLFGPTLMLRKNKSAKGSYELII